MRQLVNLQWYFLYTCLFTFYFFNLSAIDNVQLGGKEKILVKSGWIEVTPKEYIHKQTLQYPKNGDTDKKTWSQLLKASSQ